MIDPHVAWRVDGRALLRLIPGLDQSMLNEVRSIIARQMQGREAAKTWQGALNAASSATPHSPGTISFHAHGRCEDCNGRRIDLRRGRPCLTCMARGSIYQRRTYRVLFAPEPEDDE